MLKDSRHRGVDRRELDGVNLRTANWEVVPTGKKDVAQFRRTLPEKGLEITKTYRLAKVPEESLTDGNYPGVSPGVRDRDSQHRQAGEAHKVAYRLDGPNGLPTEGEWYASKVTPLGRSGLARLRHLVRRRTPGMVGGHDHRRRQGCLAVGPTRRPTRC